MINDFKTAKCLLEKAQEFTEANGLELAIFGEQYDPKPDTAYIKEQLILNTVEPTGFSSRSGDMQLPIYQLSVFTPKHEGRFLGLHLAGLLKDFFPKSSFLYNDGRQKIQVEIVDVAQLESNKTHNQIAVSVSLIVFASNT